MAANPKSDQLRAMREAALDPLVGDRAAVPAPLALVAAIAAHKGETDSALSAAIHCAREEGHSLRSIAEAAGMTHPAVSAIVKRERESLAP